MPYELEYNNDKKFLTITIKGQFSPEGFFEEFSYMAEKITHSDDFPPDVPILWDVRMVNLPNIDANYERRLIEIRKKYPERGNSKIAILVSNDFAFGMSRMYEMLSGTLPQNIMVFKDYDKGEQWLLEQ